MCAAGFLTASSPQAQMTNQSSYPEAQLTNGQLRVRVYLPDAQKGFYRSTRFDWSGAIPSLQYQGHEYYGPWFTKHDPAVRDFVYQGSDIVVSSQSGMVGPVEEFRTPLGYMQAKAGETFVKIGVGVLRKPDDAQYSGYANYDIVDSGKWTVDHDATSVTTSQEINDASSGYGYVYRKVMRLTPGKPELVIEHSLKNIGRLAIQTRQYNHNFLVLDGAATGPDFVITVPFQIQTRPGKGAPDAEFAAVEGNKIVYRKKLEGQDRATVNGIQGYAADAKDYDIRIENKASGAGVRITSDRPLAAESLWSIRSVIAMEPDVDVSTAPGATTSWTYTYTYYTTK
jgi:hypothetical protein